MIQLCGSCFIIVGESISKKGMDWDPQAWRTPCIIIFVNFRVLQITQNRNGLQPFSEAYELAALLDPLA